MAYTCPTELAAVIQSTDRPDSFVVTRTAAYTLGMAFNELLDGMYRAEALTWEAVFESGKLPERFACLCDAVERGADYVNGYRHDGSRGFPALTIIPG